MGVDHHRLAIEEIAVETHLAKAHGRLSFNHDRRFDRDSRNRFTQSPERGAQCIQRVAMCGALMVSIEQPVILHIGLAIIERTPDRLMREIGARLGSLAGERGEAGNRQHGFQSRHDELSHK